MSKPQSDESSERADATDLAMSAPFERSSSTNGSLLVVRFRLSIPISLFACMIGKLIPDVISSYFSSCAKRLSL